MSYKYNQTLSTQAVFAFNLVRLGAARNTCITLVIARSIGKTIERLNYWTSLWRCLILCCRLKLQLDLEVELAHLEIANDKLIALLEVSSICIMSSSFMKWRSSSVLVFKCLPWPTVRCKMHCFAKCVHTCTYLSSTGKFYSFILIIPCVLLSQLQLLHSKLFSLCGFLAFTKFTRVHKYSNYFEV